MFTLPRKFITNGLAGCSNTSTGLASCSIAPLVHDHDAVGKLERLFLIVRHEHARQADLLVKTAQPAPQLLPHLGIERAERLVEQQHLGLDRQRARKRHALALAAGELRGIAIAQVVELHQLQQVRHLRGDRLVRRPMRARAARGDRTRRSRTPSCGGRARSAERRSPRGARRPADASRPRRRTAPCRRRAIRARRRCAAASSCRSPTARAARRARRGAPRSSRRAAPRSCRRSC